MLKCLTGAHLCIYLHQIKTLTKFIMKNTHTNDKAFTTKQIIYFLLGACTFLTALAYLLIKNNA